MDLIVDGTNNRIAFPGKQIKSCVLKNIAKDCIGTFLVCSPANSTIEQHYCEAGGDGITILGPSTGVTALIKKNVVTAGSRGIDLAGGIIDAEFNIVADTTTPFSEGTLGGSGTTTLTNNLCDDLVDCVQPDAAFILNLAW